MTRTLVLLTCAAVAGSAGAQGTEATAAAAAPPSTPAATSVSSRLLGPFTVGCQAASALTDLTNSYNSGEWSRLQANARALLDAIRGRSAAGGASSGTFGPCTRSGGESNPELDQALDSLDYSRRYVALVWVGNDAFSKTQLMRAIVHTPEPEPFSADLPGIRSLTEVVLSSSPDARAISLYTSTREKDPLAEQAPDFVKAIFAPLSTTIAGLLGQVTGDQGIREFKAAQQPQLTVTIKSVALPFERATIALQMRMKDLEAAEDFAIAVDTLGGKLRFDGAGRSDIARQQITMLVDSLPVVASKHCAPSAPGATPPASQQLSSAITAPQRADNRAALDRTAKRTASACRDALDTEIKRIYDVVRPNARSGDAAIIEDVDKQFRALSVDGLASTTQLDLTFKNRPLTHFGFGAGSAVAPYATLNRVRVKIDNDTKNLVSDPLPRVMTLAFVNWSPRGYNEDSAAISPAERARLFLGAALTPDFGVVGGGNLLLFRGIGILGGGGMLFGKGAEPDEVGKPPAATSDPFKTARAWVLFFGIAYTYK